MSVKRAEGVDVAEGTRKTEEELLHPDRGAQTLPCEVGGGKETPAPASTVLIVDDEEDLARLIQKAMRREGYRTAITLTGEETITWLKDHHPDLMLLDLKLPDFHGVELLDRLAAISGTVPFIVITGQGDERVAVDMMKRGAQDYMVKDAQFLELMPAVVGRSLAHLARKKLLAAAEDERMRLEVEILEITEREKRRIGQDLHDDLGQQLVGMLFLSRALERNLASAKSPEAATARRIVDQLKDSLALTRALAQGLCPVSLEFGGLTMALKQLAERTTTLFKVVCRCQCEPKVELDCAAAIHLYRIAQEAVTNAIKHGHAKQIDIGFAIGPQVMVLSIKDDGTGVPDLDPERTGMGLRIMQYRAHVIGGQFVLQNRPDGGGTVVTCIVPATLAHPPTGMAESRPV